MATSQKARVAVNGYGVIGKRVADAVKLQDDMELVGVADVVYDYRIRVAVERGYPVYASVPEKRAEMEAAGVPVAGTLDDLLGQVDVVVDCTPKGIASKNKELYQAAGVKAIWQGGEKHELAGYSFVAQVNYAGAVNRQFARVVSCNTTALSRVIACAAPPRLGEARAGGAAAAGHGPLGVAQERHDQHRHPRNEGAEPPGTGCADGDPRPGHHHHGRRRALQPEPHPLRHGRDDAAGQPGRAAGRALGRAAHRLRAGKPTGWWRSTRSSS